MRVTNDNLYTTNRPNIWFLTAVFSTIALVSLTTRFGNISNQAKATKWAVSGVSVPLALSSLAVFANLVLKKKFIGTVVEGGFALLTCGFWAAVLPAILNPDKGLAVWNVSLGVDDNTVTSFNAIRNPNLFFFAWASFIASFSLLFDFIKKSLNLKGVQVRSWGGLTMTSFVVMIAATRQFKQLNCDFDVDNFLDGPCKRTKLAIGLGAIATLVGLIWSFLGTTIEGKIDEAIDSFLAIGVFVLWIFGVIYVTFGDEKAAAPVMSTLYFFTWGSFSLAAIMAMNSFKKLWVSVTGDSDDDTHYSDDNKIVVEHTAATIPKIEEPNKPISPGMGAPKPADFGKAPDEMQSATIPTAREPEAEA